MTEASVEHTDYTSLNDLSEEDMVADAMGAPVADATVTEPVAPELKQPLTEEEPTDLAASLLAALGEESSSDKPAEPEAAKPPINAEKLKELDTLFQDTLGVNISTAVEQMTSFSQTAEATMTRIQEAENSLALRMQEFELKQTWSNDPSVKGQDINQVVQERLAILAPIYEKLSPEIQDKLSRAGSQGVAILWEQTQGRKTPAAQVPQGRATIAPTPAQPGAGTLSEVIALESDDDFWKQLAANQQSGNLTDDVGARRSRR